MPKLGFGRRAAGAGVLLVLWAGCARQAHSPALAPVQTMGREYTIPDPGSLEISAAFTNGTGRTAYVGRCGTSLPGFTLEKLDGRRWVPAYVPYCQSILAPSLPVQPGRTVTGTVRLHLLRSERAPTLFRAGSVAGTYRLLWEVYSDSAASQTGGPMIDRELRASNPFRLRTKTRE